MRVDGRGQECSYLKWAPGEPTDVPGQACLQLWFERDGLMDDTYCSHSKFAICECPVIPFTTLGMSCLQQFADTHSLSHCLIGHVIKEVPTKGVIACGSACRDEPLCRSFNLRQGDRGDKTCQLNNITRSEADP